MTATSLLVTTSAFAQQYHRELNLVPIVGGDSDVGIGGGEVSDWAAIPNTPPTKPSPTDFRWRLENGAFITFKEQNSHLILPYQDYYFLLTVPDFGKDKRWRVDARISYTDEATLKYYGMGNASTLPPSTVNVAATEYERLHPTAQAQARVRLRQFLFVTFGTQYTYNRLEVPQDSLLYQQRSMASPEVRALIGNFGPHGVELTQVALEYDSRDSEIVTRHGMYHALQARFSPGIDALGMPYQYVQLDATARFYTTPIPRWLTISGRLVADALLGDPPFYELARFEETPAIGGSKAIRGVPAQRYYGKVKLFENFEITSELFPFHLKSKHFILGSAVFFDGGRSWTELLHAHPELDGSGVGLKYGVGTGLRLQEGTTFVVRADIAWSPDATPVGAYFAAGEIF